MDNQQERYDNTTDEDMYVECKICGKKFKTLSRHLKKHDISTKEYKENSDNQIAQVFYNQACLESLKGNLNESMDILEQALGYNKKEHSAHFTLKEIKEDADFKNLQDHIRFNEILGVYFNE